VGSITTTVLILGMHRSGTSSLAGTLQQHGLYLGNVFEWNPYNLKGNRENEKIMFLNDEVLMENGGNWHNPPVAIEWNSELANKRDKIIQTFAESGVLLWGFKDPRTVITLPFWKDGLCNIKMVGSFRHPLLVAQSLNARTPTMSIPYGLELWKRYNTQLLLYFEQKKFPIISFDASPQEYQSSLNYIIDYLGLNKTPVNQNIPFFDVALRNQNTIDGIEKIPDEILDLYEKLCQIYQRWFIL